ncbi:Ribosome-recycling factor [Bienertia sinuspersici]
MPHELQTDQERHVTPKLRRFGFTGFGFLESSPNSARLRVHLHTWTKACGTRRCVLINGACCFLSSRYFARNTMHDFGDMVHGDADYDNDGERTLIISVFTPAIGSFAEAWQVEHNPPNLDCWVSGKPSQAILSSLNHQDDVTSEPLSTLYHRILQKDVAWPSRIHYGVEFSHIPLYWEWAEDIIHRCKLTLKCRSSQCYVYLTISLLMQPSHDATLFGLSITGMLYDEVVPVDDELEDSKDVRRFLPFSCKYMFAALQRIQSKSGKSYATFEEWCRFWFRGLERYSIANTPKAVNNFSEFGDSTSWSDISEAFVILDILEKHRKQTYLAAFLSCWLCVFVLHVKNLGCIRPSSVFKLASLLANEQRVSLVILVLASIYRGLNDLSNSSNPANNKNTFRLTIPSASFGTGLSRKRKADNTTHEESSKAPATSSDKFKNKAKPSQQSSSHDPRTSSHGSSKTSRRMCFKKFLVTLLANFDITAELKACNNSFGAIVEDLLATSDPIALYAVSTIIARNSKAVHDAPPIPIVDSSFKAEDMISEANHYAVGFLVKQMKTKLLHTSQCGTRLSDVVNLKGKKEEQIKLQQAETLKIQQRSNELKKELKLLEQKESELFSTPAIYKDSLAKHDENVKD